MTWACPSCGGGNPPGTRFCGHCGTPSAPGVEATTSATGEPVVWSTVASVNGELADRLVEVPNASFLTQNIADRLVEVGGRVVEERRMVTAVFADVSGFTHLSTTVCSEELVAIIDPIVTFMNECINRYEGYVGKYAGDATLAFFGAPIAHEDDALRAVLAARDIQRGLPQVLGHIGGKAADMSVHIGVNTGQVVAGFFGGDVRMDYSILGEAVNVAQRLEAAAAGGDIFVGDATYQLVKDELRFELVGDLVVKGKDELVRAWRLVDDPEPLRATASPSSTEILGRDQELAALASTLDGLPANGGVVGVIAEPGAGKSCLMQWARARAETLGVRWLDARSISYGASIPYWPFVELLRRSFGIHFEQDPQLAAQSMFADLTAAGLPDAAPYFVRLLGLPALPGAADITQLQPDAFHRGLTGAILSWLSREASERGLVLAVEDLHWADASSIEILTHVAAMTTQAPVLLYLTGRLEADQVLGRLLGHGSDDHVVLMELSPLGAEAITSLVSRLLSGPPTVAFVEFVLERTSGNPLFAEELVRSLRDSGALIASTEGWCTRSGWDASTAPPNVEGVLGARIDLLPRAAARVLQVASVVGRRVNLALVQGAADLGPQLPLHIDQLVGAGFLDRTRVDGEDIVVFHHALMVDVAYARLVRRERIELHRRVGETAEAMYGTGDDVLDLLARHFYLAEAGIKAVNYLEKAGARAKAMFANDQAILHLQRAVELARTSERLVTRLPDLLLEAADVEELSGRYEEAARDYDEVRSLRAEVRAWRGLASVLRRWGRPADALEVLDAGLSAAELAEQELAALWLERSSTLIGEGRLSGALESARSGLAVVGDHASAVAGYLLLRLARAQEVLGRAQEALTNVQEAQSIFEALEDLPGLSFALRITSGIQRQLGLFDDAAETARRGFDLAERTGSAEERGGCLVNLGMAELKRGRIEEAIECDRGAIDVFTSTGHANGLMIAEGNLAEKLTVVGQLDEALVHAAQALQLADELGDTWTKGDVHRTMAMIHAARGDAARACQLAEAAMAHFVESGDADSAAESLELAAEQFIALGDAERAQEVRSRARLLTQQS